MEPCYNCGRTEPLQDSHIIPEFFYKYVYTKDHKFILVSEDNENKTKTEQKGFREYLFCHDCEELLSKQEGITAAFFNDLVQGTQTTIKTSQIREDILLVENYNYDVIKKCLLSILWRASISGLKNFENYDLGPYNTIFQNLIFSKDAIPWNVFPIHISKVKLGDDFSSELILCHKKGQYKDKTLYSITLAGYNIDYYITDSFTENYKVYFMNEKFCGITDIDLKELMMTEKLFNRFKDSDVTEFYKKHK